MKSKVLVWTLTAVLLAGAWGLSKATLSDDATIAPFRTEAEIGEPALARNLEVTITDVRLARSVRDAEGWTADGNWLVVDLQAASVVTQEGSTLRLAELVVSERTFSATDRGTTFTGQRLITGVPRAGSLTFELPDDALDGPATLRLGLTTGFSGEVLLDGVIELPLVLDELPFEGEAVLQENGWAR
ncbi:MAG TPA: hypothetical protein VN241_03065 [Microbacterium sp.]|nr:hypothetical protein [Microbacterium sp.]